MSTERTVKAQRPAPLRAARGSALAKRIADALMEGWQGFHATRLQLRGPEEQDMGGLCYEAAVSVIDRVLQAEAPNDQAEPLPPDNARGRH